MEYIDILSGLVPNDNDTTILKPEFLLESVTNEEWEIIELECKDTIEEYIEENALKMSQKDFVETAASEIHDYMFSIGVVLYSTIFGNELWSSIEYRNPDDKIKDLNKLYSRIGKIIETSTNQQANLVFQILISLLPAEINNMISFDNFTRLVDQLDTNDFLSDTQPKNKRRRLQ